MNDLDKTLSKLVSKMNSNEVNPLMMPQSFVKKANRRGHSTSQYVGRGMAPPPISRSHILKRPTKKNYDYSKNFKSGVVSHKGINYCNIYPGPDFFRTEELINN
jgi:hypothetical protein